MRRKKQYFAISAAILLSMSIAACGEEGTGRQTPSESETTVVQETEVPENIDIVTSGEELPFPLGQKIGADSFTGNAYIEMMIANDETYHFPQTNHLTFEPGAGSQEQLAYSRRNGASDHRRQRVLSGRRKAGTDLKAGRRGEY